MTRSRNPVIALYIAIAVALVLLLALRPASTSPGTEPPAIPRGFTPSVEGTAPPVIDPPMAATPAPARPRASRRLAKKPLQTQVPRPVLRQVAVHAPLAVVKGSARKLRYRVVRADDDLGFVVVEPSGRFESSAVLAQRIRGAGIAKTVNEAELVVPAITRPNDSYFSSVQWGLENRAQLSASKVGADSKAAYAWDWARGEGTVVAVVDTGVDFGNPDLAGKQWVNSDEVAGNGVDDDGNGYVDDRSGYDFFNGDGSVFDYKDADNHGTHVAGIVAASTNNALGIAGMSWYSKVMAVKFLGPGGGSNFDGALGIKYAVDNGADVINCSWGSYGYSAELVSALDYAAKRDVLIVCAAGNEGYDAEITPMYPASYPATNVISVASIDRADGLASTSNRGATSVDIGAPGVYIRSTVPRWPGALFVDDEPYKLVYLSFPLESVNATGPRETMLTESMRKLATSTADPVLLVDDAWQSRTTTTTPLDSPGTRASVYLGMLQRAGYSNVTTWSTEMSGTPTAEAMNGRTVVWFTGACSVAFSLWPSLETHGTLTTAERTEVGRFLDGGGRLLMSSGDLAWEMYAYDAMKDCYSWFREYFHAEYLSDNPSPSAASPTATLWGAGGSAFSGVSAVIDDPIRYADVCDEVGPRDDTASVLGLWPHDYRDYNGTSMAAPHVAGAVALAISRTPTLTGEVLKQRVISTADTTTALAGKCVSGGRLDAVGVVGTLTAPAPLMAWPAGIGTMQVSWTNPTQPDYASTRVVSRLDTQPVGPTDPLATILYEGTGATVAQSGLTSGTVVHYAAYARGTFGGWSAAARLTTVATDPSAGVPVPGGVNVTASSEDVRLTFSKVDVPGWLSVTKIPARQDPPVGMRWVSDQYYDIHPVGAYATPVRIELPYDPDTVGAEKSVRLYHWTGSGWEDVTVGVDTWNKRIVASTGSFSDFGVARPLGGPTVGADAGAGWLGLVSGGVSLALAQAIRRRRRRG